MNLKEAKKNRDDALAAYRAKSETGGTPAELNALSDAVKTATNAVSDVICEGAGRCPKCSAKPVGVEHEIKGGAGIEYEVGCGGLCKAFRHTDGTVRRPAGRGPMPKHAVDLWNAGPDWWNRRKEENLPPEVANEPDAPAGE